MILTFWGGRTKIADDKTRMELYFYVRRRFFS